LQAYKTAEAARLAGLPVASVRAMVKAGYVAPAKDGRGTLRFSFNDLVILRTARSLVAAQVSTRKIGHALRSLREQLPQKASLTRFTVSAVGDKVVVQEAGAIRDPASGQYLLAFDVHVDGAQVQMIDRTPERPEASAGCEALFQEALSLEETDVDAALAAYDKCIASHGHIGAHINRGRLLHEQGRIREAAEHYQRVAEPDAILLFNWGVALEDLGEIAGAVRAYDRALALDPSFADAHFNLGHLREELGQHRESLRHLSEYRRLTREDRSPR
jgi:tetratricopeptide (TPR) repeat protein